jgi:hypothetical protein
MKRNWLFTLLIAGVIGMVFIACDNPSGGGTEGPDPVFISYSTWYDDLDPETTLQFMLNTVTLGGEPSAATGNKNWYWGATMDGQSYSFALVEDSDEIEDLLDRVEDNWGTNFTILPDAVIVVWTNSAKNIGFQLHYYEASMEKNYERLICWITDKQPHEFKSR